MSGEDDDDFPAGLAGASLSPYVCRALGVEEGTTWTPELWAPFSRFDPKAMLKATEELLLGKRKAEEEIEELKRQALYWDSWKELFHLFTCHTTANDVISSSFLSGPNLIEDLATVDEGVTEGLWNAWVASMKSAEMPAAQSLEEEVQGILMSLFRLLQNSIQESSWRVITGRGILTRRYDVHEFPDAIWYLRDELFPSAAGVIMPCEFKQFSDDSNSPEKNMRDARAEAAEYGARALARQRAEDAEQLKERYITVISSNGATINFMRLVVGGDHKGHVFYRETGSLHLYTPGLRLPSAPTEGFVALVRLLHTEPGQLCSAGSPPRKKIPVLVNNNNNDMRLGQRLGSGGTCDAYVCTRSDVQAVLGSALLQEPQSDAPTASEAIGNKSGDNTSQETALEVGSSIAIIVTKVVRHRDLIKNAPLSTEAEVLEALEKVKNAPRLLYNGIGQLPLPFIVITPVGLSMLPYALLLCSRKATNATTGFTESKETSPIAPVVPEASATSSGDSHLKDNIPPLAGGEDPFESLAHRALSAAKDALAMFAADNANTILEELAVQTAQDVTPVLCGAWKQGWVHMDLRPANIVAVPENKGDCLLPAGKTVDDLSVHFEELVQLKRPFRITLIDWAASKRIDVPASEVAGVAIFQSDALLQHTYLAANRDNAWSVLRALTTAVSYSVSPREDIEALSHTLTAIVHSDGDLMPPWATCKADQVHAVRSAWYAKHIIEEPTCPCAAYWSVVHETEVKSKG